jgi:hypothetical protein
VAQQLERRREHGAHAVLAAHLGLPGLAAQAGRTSEREGERSTRFGELPWPDTLGSRPLQTRPRTRPPPRRRARDGVSSRRASRQASAGVAGAQPARMTRERRWPARADGATGWRAAGSPDRGRAGARRARPAGDRSRRHRQRGEQLQCVERRHLAAVELGERCSRPRFRRRRLAACRQSMAAASISDQTSAVAPERETVSRSSSKTGWPPARRRRSSSVFR